MLTPCTFIVDKPNGEYLEFPQILSSHEWDDNYRIKTSFTKHSRFLIKSLLLEYLPIDPDCDFKS